MSTDHLVIELAMWLIFAVGIFMQLRGARAPGNGLIVAYVIQLFMMHWLSAALRVLPHYPAPDVLLTLSGFELSLWAIAGLFIGVTLSRFFFSSGAERRLSPPPPLARRQLSQLGLRYGLAGTVFLVLFQTPVGKLPGAAAILFTGMNLVATALCLMAWQYWRKGQTGRMFAVAACSFVIPVMTIFTMGFASYGVVAVIAVMAFVASHYRPLYRLVFVAVLLFYGSLSFYVSYLDSRGDIRAVVWQNGEASSRFDVMSKAAANVRWFDSDNIADLDLIEARLNQNILLGAAATHTPRNQPYAAGDTLLLAIYALVPRAIWPEKPVQAGSMGLVSRYTGIYFEPGVSVGMGQIFEFYINFGTLGTLLGFVLLGIVLFQFDRRARRSLEAGQWTTFIRFQAIGLAMLQVGGAAAEITAAMLGAYLSCLLLERLIPRARNDLATTP